MTETVKRPLSRDLVLETAVSLVDHEGLGALSMRRLGQELGVEAMSLYHHVANKEALLDGMVDAVVGELNAEVGPGGGEEAERDWAAALRARILTARTVMLRHKWLPAVLESRTSLSAPLIAYFEGVLATLRAGGFSHDLAHHTLHALGSRAIGFSQELFDPAQGRRGRRDVGRRDGRDGAGVPAPERDAGRGRARRTRTPRSAGATTRRSSSSGSTSCSTDCGCGSVQPDSTRYGARHQRCRPTR